MFDQAKIMFTPGTVTELSKRADTARQAGDIGLLKRIDALLALARKVPPKQIAEVLRCSIQAVYIWIKEFILKGLKSLVRQKSPGRPSRLTGRQKKKLAGMIDDGPDQCGFEGACWRSPMIQELIFRKFGKLYSVKYIEFIKGVLAKNRRHIILIQDGAPYHTSKQTREFFQARQERLTVYRLPSYSPDYNPIEKLWKNIKGSHLHLHYFPTFEALKDKVREAMLKYKKLKNEILKLFGFYRDLETTEA